MSDVAIHWLRPLWLWGLLPVLVLTLLWFRRQRQGSAWDQVVDAELQPYVIESGENRKNLAPFALFVVWALTLLMLAGPVWKQQEVPVFEAQQAEVLLLDLSRSMLADDVVPDRLTRARFKLVDLLRDSEGRQTGLIAFAERPYVISPLTDDARTVQAFVPSLEPSIMPAQGSRPDLAIGRAVELLNQADSVQGHIVLISDANVTTRDAEAAKAARAMGHRVSVMAVGTAAGSPLRSADGRFLQHDDGAIVVSQLDMAGMRELARAGGGTAVRLSAGNEDMSALAQVRNSMSIHGDASEVSAQQKYWVEYSPWLLIFLLGAALSLFRKGVAG